MTRAARRPRATDHVSQTVADRDSRARLDRRLAVVTHQKELLETLAWACDPDNDIDERAATVRDLLIEDLRAHGLGTLLEENPSQRNGLCLWCRAPIQGSTRGRPKKYCAQACRQKAYSARHAKGREPRSRDTRLLAGGVSN